MKSDNGLVYVTNQGKDTYHPIERNRFTECIDNVVVVDVEDRRVVLPMAMEELIVVLLLMMIFLFQDAENSNQVQSGNDENGAKGPVHFSANHAHWPPCVLFSVFSHRVSYIFSYTKNENCVKM